MSVDARSLSDSQLMQEASVAALEEFASLQARTPGLYDARCSRQLLRLYSMFPARAKRDVELGILAKAITALPDPDFAGALCILPPSTLREAPLRALVSLERCLQQGHFEAFWEIASGGAAADAAAGAGGSGIKAVLDGIAGWRATMQTVILRLLNTIFASLDVPKLAACLNEAEPTALAVKNGWTVDASASGGAGVVFAPAVPENTPRPKKSVEDSALKHADLGSILALTR